MNNLSLSPSSAVDYYPISHSPNKETRIKAEVIFGRPGTKGCPGHGICRVETTSELNFLQKTNCASSFAFIQQNDSKQICFYFLNSSLCIKAQKKYFRKDTFQVQEPFMLPYGISQSFGMEQNFIIKNGFYPIVKTDKYSIVIF